MLRLTVALGAVVLTYAVVLALVEDGARGVVATSLLCVGQASCGVALLVPRAGEAPVLRRVWAAAGGAMLSSSGIAAVWAYYASTEQALPPLPSLADVFFVAAVVLALIAALLWPSVRRRGAERWRYLLDGFVVVIALLLITWTTLILPAAARVGADAWSVATVLPLTYPVFDLLAVVAALYAVTSSQRTERRPAVFLAAGVSVFAVGDGRFALQSASAAWNYDTLTMVLWLTAAALLVIGRFSALQLRSDAGSAVGTRSRTAILLPFAPVSVALVVAVTQDGTGVSVLGSLLVALLMIRYSVIALHDRRLVGDLVGDVRTESAFLHATLQHLTDPVLAVDGTGCVRFFNHAYQSLRPGVAVGDRLAAAAGELFDEQGRPVPERDLPLHRALQGETVPERVLVLHTDSGDTRFLRTAARPIRRATRAGDGAVAGAVLVAQDVTDARRAEAHLRRRATTDELTGLYNRTHFLDRITAAVSHDDPGSVAVLLLDLDDFKNVNDSLGHQIGDALLVGVGWRVRQVLRSGDCAARLGGDEFVLLIRNTDAAGAMLVAQRLLDSLDEPIALDGTELSISASIGLAMCDSAVEPQKVLGAADLAMYLAKQRGKGGIAEFESQLQEAAQARLSLENDLRRAVRNDELHLVYQPIVDLATGALAGVEALVRWQDPVRGFVSPGDFIPVAEETGLILPLGEWVLREAVAQLARWNEAFPQTALVLSVNVSSRQLERHGLVAAVDALLAEGLNPAQLVVEITETALGLDDDATMHTLHALRDRGVHLAVDDFGTGYSSLSRLRAAPVSRLKIDRSFVSEIVRGGSDVPIVDATMAMARGLGLGVVAEGIETQAQLHYLRRLGCPQAQGYLLARPLAPAAVDDILAGNVPWTDLVRPDVAVAQDPSPELGHLLDLAITSSVDVEQLVRPLLDDLARLTGLTTTYLTRLTDGGRQQRVEYTNTGPDVALVEGTTVAWEDSLCRRALGQGVARTDDAVGAFPDTDVASELGITSYLVEPLRDAEGRLYGTLCGASSSPVALTEADSATARLFARLLAEKLRTATAAEVEAAAQDSLGAHVAHPPVDQPGSAAGDAADLQRRRARAREMWEAKRAAYVAPDSSPEALQAATDGNDDMLRSRILRRQAHDVFVQRSRELDAAGTAGVDVSQFRVMIAEDDAVVRLIVTSLVEEEPTLRVVAEAHTGAATIGIAIAEQPDLLILDFDLGDMSALSIIPELRQFSPATRILLHSGRDDVHQIGQRLGVDRAVRKLDGPPRLQEALQSLTLGLVAAR